MTRELRLSLRKWNSILLDKLSLINDNQVIIMQDIVKYFTGKKKMACDCEPIQVSLLI